MENNASTKHQRNYMLLVLKGCAMGAADVVPGVSGGTIAFITGIYEELINSIRSFDLQAARLFFTLKWRSFWKKVNGNFLVSVLCGIAISIFSLAKLMTYLLATHPIYIWSFFFGLIVASAVLIGKEVKKWDIYAFLAIGLGAAVAYGVTAATPTQTPDTWWYIILSGAIAICAMILPGISGAFILLLLGKYQFILTAVHELHIGILALFAVGAICGIIAFSHFLSWLLKNYHSLTIAMLTGFMVGSLNKIWPWKETITTYIDNKGIERVLTEANISPETYAQLNNNDPLLFQAIIMAVIGYILIWSIEKFGNKYKK